MKRFPKLAQRLFNVPLMLRPEKAEMLVAALLDHMGIAKLDRIDGTTLGAAELRQMAFDETNEDRPSRRFYKLRDGIAIIPIEGTLVHRLGGVDPWSGMVGYDQLDKKITAAREDGDVRGILLDMDSPGGETSGCFELAEKIYAGSARFGGKPIFALVNEMACSACYALAAPCDRIAGPRTLVTASIGVWTMLVDFSKRLDADGIAVTLRRAGDRKARGHPLEGWDDELIEKIDDWIEETRMIFATIVANGRGIPVAEVLATEGDWFSGPDALERRLIDGIGSPDDIFDSLRREVASA